MPKVTYANGETEQLSESTYWDRDSAFQNRLGYIGLHFMRFGRFSVAVGPADIAVDEPRSYRTPLEAPKRGSKFFEASQRDRYSQHRTLLAALDRFPTHPYAARLRAAVDDERRAFEEAV